MREGRLKRIFIFQDREEILDDHSISIRVLLQTMQSFDILNLLMFYKIPVTRL